MTTLAVVAARWNSSRLPGKVMERVGEWTALEHTVRRVQSVVQDVVVAMPNSTYDARIWQYARQTLRVPVYMYDGPEADVLGRLAACAREHRADVVVRVTPDCPFADPVLVSQCVMLAMVGQCPHVETTERVGQVNGLDVQVFGRELLERADRDITDVVSREHVDIGALAPWRQLLTYALPLPGERQHRWVLDTPEDLAWLRMIASRIDCAPPRNMTWPLVELLTQEPGLARYEP